MPFTPFRDRFRDLADRETRSITQRWGSTSGLPAGQYVFAEMFCDEPGCDCRRVLFTVIETASGRCEAVINFGWEDASFYAAWLREDDPNMVDALQGPALHLGPAQGEHANAILDLAMTLLLSDTAYVARVKRHYAMFREDVEQGNRLVPDRTNTKTPIQRTAAALRHGAFPLPAGPVRSRGQVRARGRVDDAGLAGVEQ